MQSAQAVLCSSTIKDAAAVGGTNLELRCYHSLDDLEGLRTAWNILLDEYPQATTFSTWEWLTCWWRSFGANRRLLVLAAFDATATLVGLAPLAISREAFGGFPSLRVLRLMGDGTGDSDNLDMPVRPGFEKPFTQSVLQYLETNRRSWDICEINTMPLDSPTGRTFMDACQVQKWACFEHSSNASAISLPDCWQDYISTLSEEDAKNIVRYCRRLQKRYQVRIFRCTRPEELPGCLDALFRLHQQRWQDVGQPGSFSSSGRRAFYQELSRHLLERGCLELWALELDGKIGAVQFAFRFRDRIFQLQEGYDSERSSDRLGSVLRSHVLQQLIAEGARVYDFLGGEDSYKTRWGARPGHYRTLRFAVPFTPGSAILRFVEAAGVGKEWLRRSAPLPAWKMLRKIKRATGRRT